MTVKELKKGLTSAQVLAVLFKFLLILGVVFLFLFSIDLMGSAFNRIGQSAAQTFLKATENPFIGLFMGLLITAIIQSSSTTTSMIVALVAAGSMSLANAVPMVMGANIGTTLTSTIVSLGFITKKNEFRRAISAGTVHDFFNILVTIILFPLEYYYGLLSFLSSKLSAFIIPTHWNHAAGSMNIELFLTKPLSNFVVGAIDNNWILIALSFLLLFLSIKVLSQVIYKLLIGESREKFKDLVFKSPLKSFGWGMFLTATIQSSSVTTSLSVPFVATGSISLKKLFPYIMGANIGTTLTALVAALYKSDAAVSVAFAHLLFNFIGVLLFLPFPWLRNLPISLASELGKLTMKYRIVGFLYIILMFFLIPFTLIYLSS